MKSEKPLIVAGFILISLIWGSTWIAIKIGLDSVPPFFAVAIRFTFAAIILFVLMKVRRVPLPMDRQSLALYTILAILSFSLPFALVYWGEQYIDSGLASILFAIYPFVVAIGSHLFLPNEPMNGFKITGIFLGFVGIFVIFWSDLHIGESTTTGMAAILLSTVLQGTSLIIMKKKSKHLDPVPMTFGGMAAGLIVMYALAFAFEDMQDVHFDAKGLGSILYLGSLGSVVTFVIYYWLLKRVEAIFLSLVSLVTPVLAVILGTFWLQESLSPKVYSGAALVLSGILVANGKELLSYLQRNRSRSRSQNPENRP